jgi:V/A-type H+-transporting ATPase subunit K
MPKALVVLALVALAMAAFAPTALAADPADGAVMGDNNASSVGGGIRAAGLAIGAALCIFGGAMATGRAQAAIGAGGTGAMAEKPELFGRVFILVALPETMVVLAFVLGIVIAGNI